MMDKKKSAGVLAYGIFFIICGIVCLISYFNLILSTYCSDYLFVSIIMLPLIAMSFLLGVGLLKLKNWARILCMWTASAVGLFLMFAVAFGLGGVNFGSLGVGLVLIFVATGPIIFFFTRPKVKEQFK